jgi:hypothetical protein
VVQAKRSVLTANKQNGHAPTALSTPTKHLHRTALRLVPENNLRAPKAKKSVLTPKLRNGNARGVHRTLTKILLNTEQLHAYPRRSAPVQHRSAQTPRQQHGHALHVRLTRTKM